MGGKGKQTVGYKYYMAMHMGIGRRINEIAEIRVGGLVAYDQPINIESGGRAVRIENPDLFGGDDGEGGIDGGMYVYSGHLDQELQPAMTVPGEEESWDIPAIADELGGDVPNFRGVTTIWYNGMICALNPYPKEWAFRVRRSTAGWWEDTPWYTEKAAIYLSSPRTVTRDEAISKAKIWDLFADLAARLKEEGKLSEVVEIPGEIVAMNPAHILYEINTNPEWGRGMPPELLDENSYIYAANILCEEMFGLCIPWFRQEDLRTFIQVVIDHVGGYQYVDRETGLMTFRLIRNDFDEAALPLFTPETGLLDVEDDDASSEDTAYNEIVVTGFDPVAKNDIQVRVQNLASIQSQGEIISNTIEYKGIPTKELLARVAIRELKLQQPLRKLVLKLDRRGWRITPGMPFKISFPDRGIGSMILRAAEVTDGSLVDGQIQVKAVQDVFGMPSTSFIEVSPPNWTPPQFAPEPSPEDEAYEVTWRDFALRATQAMKDAVVEGVSYIATVAREPESIQTQGYDLATRTGLESYETRASASWTTWLKLAEPLGYLDTTATFKLDNMTAFRAEFSNGMVGMLGNEQIAIVTIDSNDGTAIIKRAVADTIPQTHPADQTLWLVDDDIGTDLREYAEGETVYAKVRTRTSTGLLALSEADENVVEVRQRVFRPYPPADVKQDGESIYEVRAGISEPTLTWVERNRLTQDDQAIGYTEASIAPESGTTYTVRVFADDGETLLSTHDSISGTTWTYDSTMQTADGNPEAVYMELESSRDDISSYFFHRFRVDLRTGWGYGWSTNWGGAS